MLNPPSTGVRIANLPPGRLRPIDKSSGRETNAFSALNKYMSLPIIPYPPQAHLHPSVPTSASSCFSTSLTPSAPLYLPPAPLLTKFYLLLQGSELPLWMPTYT